MLESLSVDKRILLWDLVHIGLPRDDVPIEMLNYLKPDLIRTGGMYRIDSFFVRATIAVSRYVTQFLLRCMIT